MKQDPPAPGAHLLLACFIPLAPLSMNAIYQVIWSQKRTQLKPQARFWKTQVKGYIPSLPAMDSQSKLRLTLTYHQDWYYKNGSLRKLDLPNLTKLTVDAICEKVGCDDAQVWELVERKVQSLGKVGIQVELRRLPE